MFSKCVKDLPLNTGVGPTVWDLRELVLEGTSAPVTAAVVERYLDIAYSRVDSSRRFDAPHSLEDAMPLLLFADAVASSSVVLEYLDKVLAGNDKLGLRVHVDEELHLDIRLQRHLYVLSSAAGLLAYPVPASSGTNREQLIRRTDQRLAVQMKPIRDAVSSALEEWLHLAGRLHMTRLLRLLLGFAKMQLIPIGVGLLSQEGIRTVYSPRVLQCMPPEVLVEGFLHSCLSDLPSEIKLEAKAGLRATLATPSTACWLPLEAGTMKAVEAAPGTLTAGGTARLNATLGGLDTATRQALVGDITTKATEGIR